MSLHSYLLIIDTEPVSPDLKDYFAKFNLEIRQQSTSHPIQIEDKLPTAILIQWSILKNEPNTIQHLYNSYPVPLIVFSNHPDEESCIAMLESGADDFMSKPLYPRELHARIGSITRRVIRAQQNVTFGKEVLMFTKWRLYPASRQVFSDNNQELILSAGEFDLLLTFVQQTQRVLDREFLLLITKSAGLAPFDRRIDVQISRLRQKIETDPKKPVLIKTIRNGGYMFTARVVTMKETDADI